MEARRQPSEPVVGNGYDQARGLPRTFSAAHEQMAHSQQAPLLLGERFVRGFLAVKALEAAVAKLGPLDDLDLVAAPDAMSLLPLDATAPVLVQQALLAHCAEHGNRFAILDAPPELDSAGTGIDRLPR